MRHHEEHPECCEFEASHNSPSLAHPLSHRDTIFGGVDDPHPHQPHAIGRSRKPGPLGHGHSAQHPIHPHPQAPAAGRAAGVASPRTLSGANWVARFPGSTSNNDLEAGFRAHVVAFEAALTAAGAHLATTSTLRPVQRAYLMHWSWMIVKKGVDPRKIPAMIGVPIDWWHGTIATSNAKAREMVNGYGIRKLKVPPALNSRHTEGKAIDLHVTWKGILKVANADGTLVEIESTPRDSTNPDLIDVGTTYQVIHLKAVKKDKPHWSTDGH